LGERIETGVTIVFPWQRAGKEAGMLNHVKAMFYKPMILSMVFSLLGVTLALAASGDLDTTFSGNGWARTDLVTSNGRLRDIAIQPDGKIVAVGTLGTIHAQSFALVRYTADGKLDKTFGDNGKVETRFSPDTAIDGVAVQADGKILVAGWACQSVDFENCLGALARYTPAGALDPTFGEGGEARLVFSRLSDVALQPDGKIVVGGYVVVDEQSRRSNLVVHRYLPNGRLDRTFSGDGNVRIPIRDSFAHALAIQPGDGKIVVVGTAVNGLPDEDIVVVRLTSDGALDNTFSGNGIHRTNIDYSGHRGAEHTYALALQPDGKIVVAGQTTPPFAAARASDALIVRYNSNGTLDKTFGELVPKGRRSGKLILNFQAWWEGFSAVVVQPDGKLVLALGGTGNLSLVRLKPSGAFDPSFHGTGYVDIDLPGQVGTGSLARQSSDGKYVIGGSVLGDFLIARVLP
jgi:uncharacterized delta-60 repeat protein